MGNLFYNVQKYRDGFGITRAVLFYFHRIALVKEQFVILSKTGSLYRQPNLFRLFLSTSSVLEHELETHISDVLKTVYLLLVQIGCFHIYKNFFQSCNKSHLALFVAMDCSSITTSSHVRPVISPIRIEQENAKCIQIVNKSSSDC